MESLNTYFSEMVDIIIAAPGIVDKYIGDAIMAFFGAPVKHDDDALQAVLTGLDMLEALKVFNERQAEAGAARSSASASGSTTAWSPSATSVRRRRWTTRSSATW